MSQTGVVDARHEPRMKVRVELSSSPDNLMLLPDSGRDALRLMERLRACLPTLQIRRIVGGVALDVWQGALLRSASISQLRWEWSPIAERVVRNREWVIKHGAAVSGRVRAVLDGGITMSRRALKDVEVSYLDDHQVVNVAAMTVADGFGLCVFDEQGTGKTVTAIAAFDALVQRNEVDFALIVAPKSMVPEWKIAFEQFRPGLHAVSIAVGDRGSKSRAIANAGDVLITNFETASRMEQALTERLGRLCGRVALFVDESFSIKNLDAKRTRSLLRLREFCDRGFVLCGTPAPNTAPDLVQQFRLVDFGLSFRNVVIPDDAAAALPVVKEVVGRSDLYVRNLKQDVIPNLPNKTFTKVSVTLAGMQQELYLAALERLLLDLKSSDPRSFARKLPSFLAQRSALLQICSNPSGLAPGYSETPAKMNALDSLLADLIVDRQEKVVIWSYYRASIGALERRYQHYGLVRYDGSVTDTEARVEAVRMFQTEPSTMIFLGNPAAAGAGLTLHSARYAVYESLSNQAAHFLQSIDRIHRRGQRKDVDYFILVAERTIEEEELARLKRKHDAARDLLSDNVPDLYTRDAMISEALALKERALS